jgi:hypothetical protein
MAHTIATRNGCFGFLKAVSTSTRSPPSASKPYLADALAAVERELEAAE